MRRAVRLLALPAMLLLAGCPLTSDHPLSDPATALIDAALVGAWKAQDADTGESRTITFLPFNEHELVGFTPGDAADSVDAFRVFTSAIDNERFLNVRDLGDASSDWYLVHYTINGGKLVLSVVDDGLFGERTFATSAELSAFLQQKLSDPLLYAPAGEKRQDMVWERVSH